MTSISAQAPLSFEEYQRLCNVLHSLECGLDESLGDSCVFYSIIGAVLMREHYQRSAAVVCGGGAVRLDAEGSTLHWGERKDDGRWASTPDKFHAWIECDGWLIDLTAPEYWEAMVGAMRGPGVRLPGVDVMPSTIPRKMLQKPVSLAIGRRGLEHMGDCTFTPNPRLTLRVLAAAFGRSQTEDAIVVAVNWHRPVPAAMAPVERIQDSSGRITAIKLIDRQLSGAW